MTVQTNHELNHNKRQQNFQVQASRDWYKKGGGSQPSQFGGAPQQQQMQRVGGGNPQIHPAPQQMMQQQMMVPQQQVQQPRQVMVTAPPGTGAGQMIQISNPFTGQMMSVQIPMGVMGGQQFTVLM